MICRRGDLSLGPSSWGFWGTAGLGWELLCRGLPSSHHHPADPLSPPSTRLLSPSPASPTHGLARGTSEPRTATSSQISAKSRPAPCVRRCEQVNGLPFCGCGFPDGVSSAPSSATCLAGLKLPRCPGTRLGSAINRPWSPGRERHAVVAREPPSSRVPG